LLFSAASSEQSHDTSFHGENASPQTRAAQSYASDPRLTAIVEAWPSLAEAVRDELAERVAAATG
jgi:hypothetical protein